MKKFKLLTVAIAMSAILITGCKKETSTYNNPPLHEESNTLSKTASLISPELKAKLTKLRASLPAGYEQRVQKNSALLLTMHPQYQYMVQRALNAISPTSCNDNTALNQWLGLQMADWDSNIIFFAVVTGMLNFPT